MSKSYLEYFTLGRAAPLKDRRDYLLACNRQQALSLLALHLDTKQIMVGVQRLPPIEQVLTEAATYGITIILTAESLPALNTLAADGDGAALAGRFAHQVWYPPRDRQTAEHMAWSYGTELPQTAEDSHPEPKLMLAPHEVLAWSSEQVLVYTRQERPYCFLAEQVTLPADILLRLPPIPPRHTPPPRDHLAWLPPGFRCTAYEIEPLLGKVMMDDSPKIADDDVPDSAEVEAPNQIAHDAGSKPDGDDGVQPPPSSSTPEEEERPATSAEFNTPSHRTRKHELR
jgi:hypothetical protein